MKRIRPYYIGLIIDLLYIVIIISQWQKWFVGVARFNSHKFFLIMYICLAILYRINYRLAVYCYYHFTMAEMVCRSC